MDSIEFADRMEGYIKNFKISREKAFNMASMVKKLKESNRKLFFIQEVAEITGNHSSTVRRWIKIYYCLPGYRFKNTSKIVVPASALIDFIDSNFNPRIIRDDTGSN